MPTWSAEPKQSVTAADAVVLQQLEAGYEPGIPVIKGVSASFKTGQISAILGVNGAGKSTLMKAVAGLVSVYSGHIIRNGAAVHLELKEVLELIHRISTDIVLVSNVDDLLFITAKDSTNQVYANTFTFFVRVVPRTSSATGQLLWGRLVRIREFAFRLGLASLPSTTVGSGAPDELAVIVTKF